VSEIRAILDDEERIGGDAETGSAELLILQLDHDYGRQQHACGRELNPDE